MSLEKNEQGYPVNFHEVASPSCIRECDSAGFSEDECESYCQCFTETIEKTILYDDYQRMTTVDKSEWQDEKKTLFDYCRSHLPNSVYCEAGDDRCKYGMAIDKDDDGEPDDF